MIHVLVLSAVLAGVAPATGQPVRKTPPRGLAMLASAALPGSGQMLLGSSKRGEALMWLDGACWVGFAGLTWYSSSRERDARLFASREAGADLSMVESRYYKALELYDNSEDCNEDIRSEARDRFPSDPAAQHHYLDSLGYFGSAAWDWSSDSARYDYWDTRRSGRSAALKAKFVVAALLLNRMVSLIDCAFFARTPAAAQRVEIRPMDEQPGIKVCYRF